MISLDARLPISLQMDLRGKEISPKNRLCPRQSTNFKSLPKTHKEAHKLSFSQERCPLEPVSSLSYKSQSKNLLPALIVEKPVLHKRQKEPKTAPNNLTLDKILGSDFKPIRLNEIQDFSEELFPSRPHYGIIKRIQETAEDYDSEKENINDGNRMASAARNAGYRMTFKERKLSFERNSDEATFNPIVDKLGRKDFKLHVNTNRNLFGEGSLENGNNSPTFPVCNDSSKNSQGNIDSIVLNELANELIATPESKRSSRADEDDLSNEKKSKRKATPAVLIMANSHEFYHPNDSFCLPKINLNKEESIIHPDPYQIHPHQKNKDNHLPSLGLRSFKGLDLRDKSKEAKIRLEQSLIEHRILYDEQALFEKHGSKFGLKPQKFVRKPTKQPTYPFMPTISGCPGKNLRNSTPIVEPVHSFHHPVPQFTNRSIIQN